MNNYDNLFKTFCKNVCEPSSINNQPLNIVRKFDKGPSLNTIGQLERGLALCILNKYLYDKSIPLGESLDIKTIFKILKIEESWEEVNIKFSNQYMIVKIQDELRVFTINKQSSAKLTCMCSYDMKFIINAEYIESLHLINLAKSLDLSIYVVEANSIKERLSLIIRDYIDENKNDLILWGCTTTPKYIDGKFNLKSEINKIIRDSNKLDLSIYEYIDTKFINVELEKYISKYPSIKKNKVFIKNLLYNHLKSDNIRDEDILNDFRKNEFKLYIANTIAKRLKIEQFLKKDWEGRFAYDLLIKSNSEVIAFENKLRATFEDTIFKDNSADINFYIDDKILFLSASDENYESKTGIHTETISLGGYRFKKLIPMIIVCNHLNNREVIIHIKPEDIKKFKILKDRRNIFSY